LGLPLIFLVLDWNFALPFWGNWSQTLMEVWSESCPWCFSLAQFHWQKDFCRPFIGLEITQNQMWWGISYRYWSNWYASILPLLTCICPNLSYLITKSSRCFRISKWVTKLIVKTKVDQNSGGQQNNKLYFQLQCSVI